MATFLRARTLIGPAGADRLAEVVGVLDDPRVNGKAVQYELGKRKPGSVIV